MQNLQAKTPLDAAQKAKALHNQAHTIIDALCEIERHRENTLKAIRKHQSRGNKQLLAKADADLIVLNSKRLQARENYKKYVLIVGKILN